jgi:dihydroneopterin aldolase
MRDRIEVTGIRAHGFHGVLAEERRDGQEYVVDIAFDLDTSVAAASDDLDWTVDYGAVAALVRDIVAGEPVNLIETLAQRIAAACLLVDRIDAVDVTVHKPHPPVAEVPVDEAVVRIRRTHE